MKSSKNAYLEILNSVVTVRDMAALQDEIAMLQESLYRKGEDDYEHLVKNQVRPALNKQLEGVKGEERGVVLNKITEEVKSVKVLGLKVAVEMAVGQLEEIVMWARKNVDPRVILDVEVDPRIVAGAVIAYQGRYVDLSVRSKLEEVLKKFSL